MRFGIDSDNLGDMLVLVVAIIVVVAITLGWLV